MAILEIKKYPDPILRKKCQEVKEVTEEIKDLGQDMIETAEKKDGVGLAAPQIGKLLRIITIGTDNGSVVCINPKVIKKSRETDVMEEGCLSFPGLWLKIKRAKAVEVEAIDKDGKILKIKAEGLLSRAFQHEIDHLDGILYIDRLSFFQKLKLFKNKGGK